MAASAEQAPAAAAASEAPSTLIIDGKATAATIRAELKERADALMAKVGKAPGLAVILVGARPDSATYVRMKRKACEEVRAAPRQRMWWPGRAGRRPRQSPPARAGFVTLALDASLSLPGRCCARPPCSAQVGIADFGVNLPVEASEDEIVAAVRAANEDERVHGILVQVSGRRLVGRPPPEAWVASCNRGAFLFFAGCSGTVGARAAVARCFPVAASPSRGAGAWLGRRPRSLPRPPSRGCALLPSRSFLCPSTSTRCACSPKSRPRKTWTACTLRTSATSRSAAATLGLWPARPG